MPVKARTATMLSRIAAIIFALIAILSLVAAYECGASDGMSELT
jgi:hypothetical protein